MVVASKMSDRRRDLEDAADRDQSFRDPVLQRSDLDTHLACPPNRVHAGILPPNLVRADIIAPFLASELRRAVGYFMQNASADHRLHALLKGRYHALLTSTNIVAHKLGKKGNHAPHVSKSGKRIREAGPRDMDMDAATARVQMGEEAPPSMAPSAQEPQDKLEVLSWKIGQAHAQSAIQEGDGNLHLKVHHGEKPGTMDDNSAVMLENTETDQEAKNRMRREKMRQRAQLRYWENKEVNEKWRREGGQHETGGTDRAAIMRRSRLAVKNPERIRELHERGDTATLHGIREKFINRCHSEAARKALARLLPARDGSVATSASASGSSEASSGSGCGMPSPATAADAAWLAATLQWLWLGAPMAPEPGEYDLGESDDPCECDYDIHREDAEPRSKKMKHFGFSEDGKDNNQE